MKVGDAVLVRGKIVEADESAMPYKVDLGDETLAWFTAAEVTPAPAPPSSAPRATVEVWIAVDASGEHAAAYTEKLLDEFILDSLNTANVRKVRLSVDVPLPVPLEASVRVADDAGEVRVSQ